MKIIYLVYWMRINSVVWALGMTNVDYKYFSTGDDITLKCDCKALFWNGPEFKNAGNGTSKVDLKDIDGELNAWNLSIYTNGDKIASTLPQTILRRLRVIGKNSDLHISNLSLSDEGLFTCVSACGELENRFLLQIKLLPTKLEILNVTDNYTVKGIEHSSLDLICLVEKGKPPGVLRWRKNGTIIRQGRPSKLVYSFVPNKNDHQSVYSCEVQNIFMEKPLKQTIHLNIQYKPSIKVNVSDTLIEEGKPGHLCCSSRSNPKPLSISWFKEDKKIVSSNSESEMCYKMNNASRRDSGNYTCFSLNKIGNASREISVVISYAPVVTCTVRNGNCKEDSTMRTIQCLAEGEPNNYKYYPWEHRSLLNKHIRYLGATDDGILRLPFSNRSNIYQDTGFYICNVSNGVPDYIGNFFQQGVAYIESTGPPVFSTSTKRIQLNTGQSTAKINVNVYGSSEIKCYNLREIDGMSFTTKDIGVKVNHILLELSVRDSTVTVNGTEIIFVLNKLSSHGLRKFNVSVCNNYGRSSCIVDVNLNVNYSPVDNILSFEVTITIIVFLIIIVILVARMGIYVRYLKQIHRKSSLRMIAAMNIPLPERNIDDSAHYEDISEDVNIQIQGQVTDTQIFSTTDTIHVSVDSRGVSHVSEEPSSSISDNDIDVSEIVDDGYEKPYSTLVENGRDEIKHVYLSTTNNSTDENSIPFENAACGLSPGFRALDSSSDRANIPIYENNSHENVKLNCFKNCTNDRDIRLDVYKQNNPVEYINLSLKQ